MWIVIEMFPSPEQATIVCNEDGTNKVFNDEFEAKEEADNCQEGRIIEV